MLANWDKFLGFLEEFVDPKHGRRFLVSNELTPADFMIGSLYVDFLGNPNVPYYNAEFKALMKKHPNFCAYGDRFAEENKDHIASRAESPIGGM